MVLQSNGQKIGEGMNV